MHFELFPSLICFAAGIVLCAIILNNYHSSKVKTLEDQLKTTAQKLADAVKAKL